ncbi:MAG: hypothetical protein RL463_292 [Bacteroidota bacterium]
MRGDYSYSGFHKNTFFLYPDVVDQCWKRKQDLLDPEPFLRMVTGLRRGNQDVYHDEKTDQYVIRHVDDAPVPTESPVRGTETKLKRKAIGYPSTKKMQLRNTNQTSLQSVPGPIMKEVERFILYQKMNNLVLKISIRHLV